MKDHELNIEKIVKYWVETSDKDFKTMKNLFNSRDYNWSLFLGHLVIEKLLKAFFVKKNEKHATFSHDLLRIAKNCNLSLDETKEDWLDVITTFNINVRYDNYKQEFFRLCTKEYTEIWIKNIKELRRWLKEQL